jgi:hypothetical protein
MTIAAILLAALTLHVTGVAARTTSSSCGFVITAHVVEGGTQVTCLTSVQGYPAPRSTIRSRGTMTFKLRRGTIRARISVVQHFGANGSSARQELTGTITGGTRAYRGVHGTVSGGGTVVDTATSLGKLKLTYRLAFR